MGHPQACLQRAYCPFQKTGQFGSKSRKMMLVWYLLCSGHSPVLRALHVLTQLILTITYQVPAGTYVTDEETEAPRG